MQPPDYVYAYYCPENGAVYSRSGITLAGGKHVCWYLDKDRESKFFLSGNNEPQREYHLGCFKRNHEAAAMFWLLWDKEKEKLCQMAGSDDPMVFLSRTAEMAEPDRYDTVSYGLLARDSGST